MAFLGLITALCVWRCTKRGAQFPDMFMGMAWMAALAGLVAVGDVGAAVDALLVRAFDALKNAF